MLRSRCERTKPSPRRDMIERHVAVATPEGATETFICHPECEGPHPAVIFFMDAPGIREELRDLFRRLATAGYYVLLPNLYYCSGLRSISRRIVLTGFPLRLLPMA